MRKAPGYDNFSLRLKTSIVNRMDAIFRRAGYPSMAALARDAIEKHLDSLETSASRTRPRGRKR